MEDSTRPLNLEADLLVIGWGKAGKTLARDLASHGRRVVSNESLAYHSRGGNRVTL